jgi:hypothetical protein
MDLALGPIAVGVLHAGSMLSSDRLNAALLNVLLQAACLVGHGIKLRGPSGFIGRRRAQRSQVGLGVALVMAAGAFDFSGVPCGVGVFDTGSVLTINCDDPAMPSFGLIFDAVRLILHCLDGCRSLCLSRAGCAYGREVAVGALLIAAPWAYKAHDAPQIPKEKLSSGSPFSGADVPKLHWISQRRRHG